jgi:hypothetical protein
VIQGCGASGANGWGWYVQIRYWSEPSGPVERKMGGWEASRPSDVGLTKEGAYGEPPAGPKGPGFDGSSAAGYEAGALTALARSSAGRCDGTSVPSAGSSPWERLGRRTPRGMVDAAAATACHETKVDRARRCRRWQARRPRPDDLGQPGHLARVKRRLGRAAAAGRERGPGRQLGRRRLRCRRCRRGRQDRGKGQRGVASWVVRLDHRRRRRRFWAEAKRSSVAGPCEGPCHLRQGLKERGAQQQQQGQSRRLRSDVLCRQASDRPSTARAEGSGPGEPGETF